MATSEEAMWEHLNQEVEPLVDGGAFRQAVERLSSALEMMGEGEDTKQIRARLLARRGECLLDLEEGEEALDDARRALELGGGDAASYGLAGWASYHLDKLHKAREYFDRALALAPEEVSYLMGRAMVCMELEEYSQARADLTQALLVEEDGGELLGMRGEANLHMGNMNEAERDLRRAVEEVPEEGEWALMLARVMLARGEQKEALELVDKAVEEDSELVFEALLLRSYLRLGEGDTRAARSDAIRASNLFPDEAFAFVQLAHVQLAEESLTLAQTAAERAVLLDPSLPDSYLVRGAAHQLAGNKEDAKEDFERASQAPAELPLFLLGPAHRWMEGSAMGLDSSILEMLGQQGGAGSSPFGFDPSAFGDLFGAGAPGASEPSGEEGEQQAGPAGLGGMGGLGGLGGLGGMGGGMNPMDMLSKVFDDEGNIRGPFKPIMKMAFKNAPKIMENLPSGMLGEKEREELEKMDFSEMSSEQLEERMKRFYQMMKRAQEGQEDGDEDGEEPS